MLELVRAFAAERLRERGEEERYPGAAGPAIWRRSARRRASASHGPEQRLWRARLDAEATDLQEALRWAVATDRADLAVGLAAPLARWWWARGGCAPMAGLADATARLPSAARSRPGAPRCCGGPGARADRARPRATRPRRCSPTLVADARERDDPWMLGHGLVGLAMTRPPEDPELPALLRRRRRGPATQRRSLVGRLRAGARSATSPCWPATSRRRPRARGGAGPGARIGDDHLIATLLDQLAHRRPPRRRRAGRAGTARRSRPACTGRSATRKGWPTASTAWPGSASPSATRTDRRPALAGAADAARASLGVAVWPLLQSLVAQLDQMVATALGDEDDRRERAAGAAAGPWTTLDEGLAAISRGG